MSVVVERSNVFVGRGEDVAIAGFFFCQRTKTLRKMWLILVEKAVLMSVVSKTLRLVKSNFRFKIYFRFQIYISLKVDYTAFDWLKPDVRFHIFEARF